MKPLFLEMEGINSFIEKQTVDFKELSRNNLFCISGVTGSGKSTILDCVILGLYRKLPSSSSRGNVEDYINLRSEKAVIKLTFELDGQIYRTERVISRKAGANSVRLIDVNTGVAIKEKSDEAFAFLQEKLGLDVEQFASVIVLQQGQFAQFLKSSKADRNKMIINLFKLERLEKIPHIFKRAEERLKLVLDGLQEDLLEYEGVTQEAVKNAQREVNLSLKQVDALFKKREQSRQLLAEIKDAQQKLSDYLKAEQSKSQLLLQLSELNGRKAKASEQESVLNGQLEALEQEKIAKEQGIALLAVLKNDMQRLTEVSKKQEEITLLRTKFDQARKSLIAVSEQREAVNKRVEELTKSKLNSGMDYSLEQAGAVKGELSARLSALESDQRELDLSEARLKGYHERFVIMQAKKQESEARLTGAEKALESALESLENAKLAHSAEHIKGSLKEGDVCPICGQRITCLSKGDTVDFKALEEAAEKAKSAQATLKAEQDRLMLEFTRLSADIANEEQVRNKLAEKVANVSKQQITATISAITEYSEVLTALDTASRQLVTVEAEKSKAEARVAEIENAGKQLREQLEQIKSSLSESNPEILAQKITAQQQLIDRVTLLEKQTAEKQRQLSAETSEIMTGIAGVSAQLDAVEKTLKDKPVAPSITIEEAVERSAADERAYEQALSDSVRAERDKDELEQSYQKKQALVKKRADVKARYEKIYDVSSAMTSGKFIAFVATEYIKDFTQSASAILSELTAGKYTMEYNQAEGDFYVSDFLSSNEKRKTKTLSGGETFLASLAMAIALSQEITRYGNFDFFFIDEGFGTLHEQALEQALEVLKKLARTSLVGLVTHRTELKEKIPVTLLVTPADEQNGSRCKIV